MANYDTTYAAVRGAVVAAINTAWSPDQIIFNPAEMTTEFDTYPVVYIKTEITEDVNETPATDRRGLKFTIAGIFQVPAQGADLFAASKLTLAQAELFGATNLGGFAYGALISKPDYEIEESHDRVAVFFDFTCDVSFERAVAP